MIIAVDFDGTIVEHRYPEIGRERTFAVATLRQLQREDPELKLILWTVREGQLLQQAVDWCAKRGLHFFAVNSNYPGELPPPPRKIALPLPTAAPTPTAGSNSATGTPAEASAVGTSTTAAGTTGTAPASTVGITLDEAPACRKVVADIYIDDRNLRGLPDWPTIYRLIASRRSTNPLPHSDSTTDPHAHPSTSPDGHPSLLRRLLRRR